MYEHTHFKIVESELSEVYLHLKIKTIQHATHNQETTTLFQTLKACTTRSQHTHQLKQSFVNDYENINDLIQEQS